MFNACRNCGEDRPDKIIDPSGPYAICPLCGHKHPFLRLPLFIVTGASRAGKTTICLQLASSMDDVVVFDGDVLWRKEFENPGADILEFRNFCLRVCKNISQAGRPVVLCASAPPRQLEQCVERRYFDQLYYMVVTCDERSLKERLPKRARWWHSGTDEMIRQQLQFNKSLLRMVREKPDFIAMVNMSELSLEDGVSKVKTWIHGKLAMPNQSLEARAGAAAAELDLGRH
jgi:hypothetical protein